MPLISIVIPVYNAEEFIEKCIKSILGQTYNDWELILVNDGSIDNSYNICTQLSERDSRIHVICQTNNGVSSARNKGLELCNGQYICFVDADDWLEPSYLSEMITNTNQAELVVSGQIRDFEDGSVVVYKPQETTTFVIDSNNADKYVFLDSSLLLYAPHEKLYKTCIIKDNNLKFQKGCSYGEDLIFNYDYLRYVNRISTINKALYHYRMGNNTLSTKLRPNQFREDYEQWKILEAFYKERNLLNDKAKEYLYKRLWGIVYDGIFLYPTLENPCSNYISYILNIPEIESLNQYQYVFTCAKWIKWCILYKQTMALRIYLNNFYK